MKKQSVTMLTGLLPLLLLLFLTQTAGTATAAAAAAAEVQDTRGRTIHFDAPPTRVVSIVPSATEIICTLKAADALTGVTFHSSLPAEKNGKTVVGGFLSPDLGTILSLDPDLVFVTDIQADTARELEARGIRTLYIDTLSFEQSLDNIRMIGAIFDKEKEAAASIATIRDQIETVRQKVAKIPMDQRKRVFRLMGRESVMTPAKGAFLNDLVRLAGGIPMAPEADGMVAEVSLEQWKAFNPQVIFGCGGDKTAAETFFTRPGWNSVDGVKNHKIYYFPCELTCRAACHSGYFVQWLAAVIYSDHFFTPDNLIHKDARLASEPVPINLGIIKQSQRIKVSIADFTHKTLVIDFKSPQTVLSTLEGLKHNISTIANHYLPPPSWTMPHAGGMAGTKQRILSAVERDPASTSLLMTGADMDHVTVTEKRYKKMRAMAVVTAGVCSNAQRMSRAVGGYYEPGTINIMVMTNMRLSQRAMARAMITATEAKTAALSDLDIRSSYQGLEYQATGTGTDNIIMVQGEGCPIDNTGGHSKMGELIAKAVYDGVTKAVFLQNGLKNDRNIFQRLQERGITVSSLVRGSGCQCAPGTLDRMAAGLEALLMEPRYAGLVETALAVCDARNKGLIHDLSLFSDLGRTAAATLAGEPVPGPLTFTTTNDLPAPLKITFNWLMTGLQKQNDKE